ncbi:23S rRNA (uracil(1939)-C(5))-methyltransferase RlmD [Thermosediminibacter oceani]|uniref:23S rRNA m(5)U-1939 methyltransferase n=1 Tax=Thermosediminibacter oceani (strain ATCC BAA-1034 / DSM 16646 / JW/IW-1228P) TaxID=555079 RepID=D9RY73_THEOJ|nr:23S rRNA (uracil(1939)-C(5))-methyltransferase RlmD [Thermosediminibacter oceani]ADL08297.1 23S rRNA m(5)U-1939 methyltransferase [Thermosediminibacter oceani DSM 16646]
MLKKRDRIAIDITAMAHEGQGVGRVDGLAVFVEGALKGERVLAVVEKVSKNYAIARAEEIISPSPDRIIPRCPHADECGGCSLQHLSYKGQLEFKTQKVRDSLERIGRIYTTVFDTIGMEDPWKYRNKAQYPVGKKDYRPALGFYMKRSHDLVPIEGCLIQHELSWRAAEVVRDWMEKFRVSIYDEINHKGLIRHVVTRIGAKTGEVMVVLVINGREVPHLRELLGALEKNVEGLKSVYLNVNTKKTNVIMGDENILVYGEPHIIDFIGEIKFTLSPNSFFQVNPVQVEVLYKKVMEYAGLTGEETVIDAYCGIGTITLFLAGKARMVYGIEVVPQAVMDARNNALLNGIENVEFIEGAAEEVMPQLVERGIRADVIVMDPPRRGCDEKLLDAAVKMNPPRMVYVSCNPATLARDLRYLEDRGYRTELVQPVDMFPFTHHVECVALIKKT